MIKKSLALYFFIIEKIRRKTVMKKINTTQLLGVAVTVLSLLGVFLSSKVHDREMAELKQDIISELAKKGV